MLSKMFEASFKTRDTERFRIAATQNVNVESDVHQFLLSCFHRECSKARHVMPVLSNDKVHSLVSKIQRYLPFVSYKTVRRTATFSVHCVTTKL